MSRAFPPVPCVTGRAVPLVRDNVDTDAIIPSREIRGVGKTGLAAGLFAGWRGQPGFVLDDPAWAGAPILLSGANFGCGSSREHAVWALHEWGFRAVVGESFAPIFRANCIVNGIVPAAIDRAAIEALAAAGGDVTVDIAARLVSGPNVDATFALDEEHARMLSEGLDGIALTLTRAAEIDAFLAADRAARPWIYEVAA